MAPTPIWWTHWHRRASAICCGEDLRFLFCLREPATRAISAYWHQAKKGRERRSLSEALAFDSESLDAAICEEEGRLEHAAAHGRIDLVDCAKRFDDPLWNFRYLRNSLYASDLARFQTTFGASRIKVFLFEELISDPGATLASVAAFLGLDPRGISSPARLAPQCYHADASTNFASRAPSIAGP